MLELALNEGIAKSTPKAGSTADAQPVAQTIKKSDDELQIVWGEVYIPDIPDSQGDFATAETIQKAAYEFIAKGKVNQIGIEHAPEKGKAVIVESFIARKGDPDFIEGSWVLGVHIPNETTWGLVKSGELNGFSFEGISQKQTKTVELTMPTLIKGETDTAVDHSHDFTVQYGPSGEFIGGMTSPAEDGHYHMITKGTATAVAAKADGTEHSHRFSFVEGILDAEILTDS